VLILGYGILSTTIALDAFAQLLWMPSFLVLKSLKLLIFNKKNNLKKSTYPAE